MSNTLLSYIEPPKNAQDTVFTLQSPRSAYKIRVELFHCDRGYLSTVKRVICLHSAPHSVSLFLSMKDQADLALYCCPLLAFKEEKAYVLAYTAKYHYPLAILTVMDDLNDLFVRNGVPTYHRRWCTRIFKIQACKLFYRKTIPSGVVEYIGIQAHHSKSRSMMNPRRCRDAKSSSTYTIFREYPIFTLSEQDNLTLMRAHGIPPSINYSSLNRHGCFLCPFAGRKYYEQLQQQNPALFAECQRLMTKGSIGRGDPPYYYYPKDRLI